MNEHDKLVGGEAIEQGIKPMELTRDERAVLVEMDFNVNNTVTVHETSIEFWTLQEDDNFKPNLEVPLTQIRLANERISLAIERIAAALPKLQVHTNPVIRALHQPVANTLSILRRVHTIGMELEVNMAANLEFEYSETSPLVSKFNGFAEELQALMISVESDMMAVQNNSAYKAYRDRGESLRGTIEWI